MKNMMDVRVSPSTIRYGQIQDRARNLLENRGIEGHVSAVRFVEDFIHYLISYDALGFGDAEDTLSLLENDDNLTDGNILNTNFRKDFEELISISLRNDPIFSLLYPVLLNNKGKGVGVGELLLPLILSNYRFSNDSDGMLNGNQKVEIKADGASLKPVPTGVTEKGLVDILNKKYFKGTTPGMTAKKNFQAHLATVTDPSLYEGYFKELYVGCDTTALYEEVAKVYMDPKKFNLAVGKFALKEYQKTDGWNNILFIDCEKLKVVNIADTDNVDGGLKFSPKLKRARDTQAIADGYVNVKI